MVMSTRKVNNYDKDMFTSQSLKSCIVIIYYSHSLSSLYFEGGLLKEKAFRIVTAKILHQMHHQYCHVNLALTEKGLGPIQLGHLFRVIFIHFCHQYSRYHATFHKWNSDSGVIFRHYGFCFFHFLILNYWSFLYTSQIDILLTLILLKFYLQKKLKDEI